VEVIVFVIRLMNVVWLHALLEREMAERIGELFFNVRGQFTDL